MAQVNDPKDMSDTQQTGSKPPNLEELKAELEQGSERSWGDVNPLKVLRKRK